MTSIMNKSHVLLWLVYLGFLSLVHLHITARVPDFYMDEIFHGPQAQAYCKLNFKHWDNKITTPPGLYLISTALHWASARLWPCSVSGLRSTNVLLGSFLPFVIKDVYLSLHHDPARASTKPETHALQHGSAMAALPVLWFFNFLYYTDVASTLFVLLAYRACLKESYATASMLGVVSLLFRQTNVIWLCPVVATAFARQLSSAGLHDPLLQDVTLYALPKTCIRAVHTALVSAPRTTLRLVALFAPIPLSFVGFLYWNGGIVLGDKSNHQPALHFPQLFYFLAFATVHMAPFVLSPRSVKKAVFTMVGSPWRVACTSLLTLFSAYLVHYYTLEHPFLLADNRHYAFYVWRKIYKRHSVVPYALIPAYVLAGVLVFRRVQASARLVFGLAWTLATGLALVASPLLEPRYFIMPYLFLRLHLREASLDGVSKSLLMEGAGVVAVNAVSLWLFVERPFIWPQEPLQWQRFMW